MSTKLTPDAEQHYRIIRQKMDTVGGEGRAGAKADVPHIFYL